MTLHKLLRVFPWLLSSALLMGQGKGVAPAELLKPLKDSWPSYNGDYSGKRYSVLTQVNQSNVKHLTLAWSARVTPGPATPQGGFGFGAFARAGGRLRTASRAARLLALVSGVGRRSTPEPGAVASMAATRSATGATSSPHLGSVSASSCVSGGKIRHPP